MFQRMLEEEYNTFKKAKNILGGGGWKSIVSIWHNWVPFVMCLDCRCAASAISVILHSPK